MMLMEIEQRVVPRWLRIWAYLTLICAAAVLILGALITTFRVGMSDPVWPTEPWFLVVNDHVWANEPAPGFLIEHTHRLVAWCIGVFATVLAIGAWTTEPNRKVRICGLVAVILLLVAYLAFHGEMGGAWRARKAGGNLRWPYATGALCLTCLVAAIGVSAWAWKQRSTGAIFRIVATAALVAVMIQGLLGGYRVFLDQLMGTQLAAIHGSFGQVTFALLAAVVVLAAAPRIGSEIDDRTLAKLSVTLVALVLAQLVWGVWMRHLGSTTAQRLHLFTAFLVFGIGTILAMRIFNGGASLQSLRYSAIQLLGIFAVQIYLGIEAYLGKFAVTGSAALLPPELRPVETTAAVVRTAHTLIGAALLGSIVALAVRIRLMMPVEERTLSYTINVDPSESETRELLRIG